MTVNADEFKQAMQLWASGVTVVTAQSADFGLQGMTVSSFASVSAEPPQILVCINQSADTGDGIAASGFFAVNVLASGQEAVSGQFSGGASQQQRFEQNPWQAGVTGAPVLAGALMALECAVVDKIKAGSHWVIIGAVAACHCRGGEPLLYYRGGYRLLADQQP